MANIPSRQTAAGPDGHSGAETFARQHRTWRGMQRLMRLRMLLLAIAAFGYFANGAQAHLQISQGESLSLMLCGTDANRTVELVIPGEPAEEITDTCCGDCSPPSALTPPRATHEVTSLIYAAPVPTHLPAAISPKSPLWPGAPPQGPPVRLTFEI